LVIMTAFGADMRRLMAERGISLRQLARIVNYDVGYLCKVKNGCKPPSAAIAARVDAALGAGDALTALAPIRPPHRHPHDEQATVTAGALGPHHHEHPGQRPPSLTTGGITLTLPCMPVRVVIEISEIGQVAHTPRGAGRSRDRAEPGHWWTSSRHAKARTRQAEHAVPAG
jgi:transcriptional regulator with XRE-family HTH domain